MEQKPATVRIEDLLAHREWVRRMARALVRDDASADDLEQEVWTSALRGPPADRGLSLRGWLATVLRFRAIDQRRAAARRRSREESVARDEREPAVDEVVARGEMVKRVVMAVMDLDEPYRSMVLLRYFEDLSPAALAARQGVPLETVRTRLRRALARLRERLDADHRGDRRAWVAMLLPLAGHPGGEPSGKASQTVPVGTAGVAAGALAMTAKGKSALVAVGVALLLGGWWFLADNAGRDPSGRGVVARGSGPRGATGSPDSRSAPAGEGIESALAVETPESADRPRGLLRGIVVAADGRTPAVGVEVTVLPAAGLVPEGMRAPPTPYRARQARTDARGRFMLEGVPAGAWSLEVKDASLGRARETGIAGEDPPWSFLVLGQADVGRKVLAVRTFDTEGSPLPGARVVASPGPEGTPVVATADAEGRARLEVNSHWPVLLLATHRGAAAQLVVNSGGRSAFVPGEAPYRLLQLGRDSEVPLTLQSTGTLSGRVVPPVGGTVEGAVVQAWPFVMAVRGTPAEAEVTANGEYRIPGLFAGKFVLLVRHPAGLRVRSPVAVDPNSQGTSLDLPTAVVAPGEETTCDLALEPGGSIRGRVERPDGSPVAGARVEMHLPLGNGDGEQRTERAGVPLWRLDYDGWGDDRRPPASWIVTETDAAGRYEVRGLVPADTWRVRVVPGPDLAFDLRAPVVVEAGKATEILHRVIPAGTLEAMLLPAWCYALRRIGEERCQAAFITASKSGAVRIPGLAGGEWEIFTVRTITHEELVPDGRFSIRAGETTYVDLTGKGLTPVVLRFEQDGRPSEGVEVHSTFARGIRYSGTDGTVHLREWVRDDTSGGPGAATVVFSFRAPGPDATRLGWNPRLEGPGADGGWQATVPVPTGRLSLRCVDSQGRPQAGVSVSLSDRSFPMSTPAHPGADRNGPRLGESAARMSDAGGAVAFGTLPVRRRYHWTATFPDGQVCAGDVGVDDSEPHEVFVSATEAGSVRVTVLLPDGKPASRATVMFVPPPREPPARQPGTDGAGGGLEALGRDAWSMEEWSWGGGVRYVKGETDDEGVLVVRGVRAGAVWVAAVPRGRSVNSSRELREVSEVVEVQAVPPGEAPVTVRLRASR